MSISNLNHYRTAKVLVKELDDIITKLNQFNTEMQPYSKYIPIQDIHHNISSNIMLLKIHLNKYQEVIKNKGILHDDSMDQA